MNAIIDFDPERRTNARAILDLSRLGFFERGDTVLDITVGPERGFWKEWKPLNLTTNDIDPNVKAQHHDNAAALPWGDRTYDVTVFDPPYANRGTAKRGNGHDDIDQRYGTGKYRSRREVEKLLREGTAEAVRVCDRLALVKCQDANVASRYAPQSYLVNEAATKAGARLIGELYVIGRREQPTGKRQLNIWTNCSTLMIFKRGSETVRRPLDYTDDQ